MNKKLYFALLLALVLALTATPAFAQGSRNDRFCAGGNSTVNAGETVQDYTLFGCNGAIQSGAKVLGNVFLMGGNLTAEKDSTVEGDVVLFGGTLAVGGTVNGNVVLVGGSLRLDDSAVVNGNVNLAGGSVSRAPGAVVRGSVNQQNRTGGAFPSLTRPYFNPFQYDFLGLNLLRDFIAAVALAALGALLVVLLPDPTRRVLATAEKQPLPSYGVGCLTAILLPALIVLFGITLIGIPVSFLLALAAAAAAMFGWIALGYLAGERILQGLKVREFTPVIAVVVGVLVLAVIGAVPCLGGVITWLVLVPLGLGAVLLTRFGTRPYPYTSAFAPSGTLPPGPLPPAPLSPTSPSSQPAAVEGPREPLPPEPGTGER